MNESETLTIDRILPALKANNQKHVFQVITEYAARETGLRQDDMLDELWALEDTTSPSGIGGGVAIPQLSVPGLEKPYMLFARLPHSADYKSVDGEPVDLICLLLSPEEDGPLHLQRLFRISRLLRDQDLCKKLRGADNADTLRALLYDSSAARLAA